MVSSVIIMPVFLAVWKWIKNSAAFPTIQPFVPVAEDFVQKQYGGRFSRNPLKKQSFRECGSGESQDS